MSTPTETTALDHNVGTSKYVQFKVQPIEFSLHNELDAALHSILKYISPRRDSGRQSDLKKALHFIELREHIVGNIPYYEGLRIPMSSYATQFVGEEHADTRTALYALEDYIITGITKRLRLTLQSMIDGLETKSAPAPKKAAASSKNK